MPRRAFTIGQAAAQAGVSADTIRYYERQGVVPRAARSSAGYRLYSEDAIARIQLVKNAVRFGFAVKELAVFLRACDTGRPPCQKVRAAGGRLLAEMDRRLTEMATARTQMQTTLATWDRALEATAPGSPARLLHSIPVSQVSTTRIRRP